MAQIIIEIPDHLVEDFLGYMSDGGGEYHFMDWHSGEYPGKYLDFNYPGWKDKIVITEHSENG